MITGLEKKEWIWKFQKILCISSNSAYITNIYQKLPYTKVPSTTTFKELRRVSHLLLHDKRMEILAF